MLPKRISVKYFVESSQAENINLEKFVPVFQKWIQKHSVEGLLIDVADYKHVPQGPGIMLIGHEGDYSLDLREGHPGLLYARKRDLSGELPDALALVLRLALSACQQLESERPLKGLVFDYATAEIIFLDRLNYPNKPETFALVQDPIQNFAAQIYGDQNITVEAVPNDPRDNFTVRVITPKAELTAQTLLGRIGVAVPE